VQLKSFPHTTLESTTQVCHKALEQSDPSVTILQCHLAIHKHTVPSSPPLYIHLPSFW
jgi:hypothetical protein